MNAILTLTSYTCAVIAGAFFIGGIAVLSGGRHV